MATSIDAATLLPAVHDGISSHVSEDEHAFQYWFSETSQAVEVFATPTASSNLTCPAAL